MKSFSLSLSLSLLLSSSLSLSLIPLHHHNINLPLSLPCSIPSSKTASLHFYSGYTTHHCLRSPYSVSLPLPVSISLPPHPLRFIQPETVFPLYSLFLSSLLETFATRIVPLSRGIPTAVTRGTGCLYSLHSSLFPPLWFLSPRHANTRFFWVWIFSFFFFLF